MEQMDRRIRKTKQRLSEALIALILEKGYEKVTILDIIGKADVGRSTFYTHYESKEQLFLEGHRNLGIPLFSGMGDAGGKGKSAALGFLPLFRHAGGNLPLAKAMFGKKSGDLFLGHLRDHVAERIREEFKGRFPRTKDGKAWLAYHAAAAAAAVMGFLVAWMEDGIPFPDTEIAEQARQAVLGIFSGAERA